MPTTSTCHRSSLVNISTLLLTLGLGGCAPRTEVNDDAFKPTPVKAVVVTEQPVQRTTTQPATIHSWYRAEIRARVSGYVREVKADIGDYVEEGAVLATIAVPEMEKQREIINARISRHQSEERRARAGVELAEANITSSEAKLAQAKSELLRVEASLAAAESEFKRVEDLVQRRSLEDRLLVEARKKRDSERAAKDVAASAIQAAEADVTVAKAKKNSAKADVDAAEAETLIARRQLDELDVLISYATLKAPFAGVVTARHVHPGNLVRETNEVGNGQPLLVVSQISKVRVHIPVPEADAAYVRAGDNVTLNLPSFSAEGPVDVKVKRVAGDLDPSTRTMLVEAEMENPDNKLLPGMFGEASIHLGAKTALAMLPARAVRFKENGDAYVYVIDDDNTVKVTAVTTGHDNGHAIEMTSGVAVGERVIDAHLQRFQTDQKVTLLP